MRLELSNILPFQVKLSVQMNYKHALRTFCLVTHSPDMAAVFADCKGSIATNKCLLWDLA